MNPLEAADPWEWLLIIGLWALWLLCLLGMLILIFAVLVGFARGLKGILKPFKRRNLGRHVQGKR